MAQYLLPASLLDQIDRAPQVGPKLLRVESVDQSMAIAVRAHLVPAVADGADQVWKFFRHPAQNEKRGRDPALAQHVQDLVRVSLDAAFELVPIVKRHDRSEERRV